MQAYTNLQTDIAQQPIVKEVEFVRLHLGPLSRSLQESARQWVISLGRLMNDSAKQSLLELKEKLDVSACLSTQYTHVSSINPQIGQSDQAFYSLPRQYNLLRNM